MNITILLLLSIITFTEILKVFKLNFKSKTPVFCIIQLNGEIENIEYILRSLKWESKADKVLLVDNNATENTLEICKKFCKENPLFILCEKSDLFSFLVF